jgi:hypothetical protein
MFEPVFQSLRMMTEANLQMQQELFKRWVGMRTGMAAPNGGGEPIVQAQKRGAKFVAELAKTQREALEAQFSAGLKNIEEACRLAEAKDPEELRARTVELWQKSFDCVGQMYEAQMRGFQAAVSRWTELVTQGAA